MDDARKVSQELASRDLDDIKALRESLPFVRYFSRRLNEKRAQHQENFLRGKLTYEERETARQMVLEYESLLSMLEKEEAACRNVLEQGR